MSFSFGGTSVAQPAAAAPSGFSFGSAAPATSSGFSFGGASTPAPAATGGGFSFGSSTGTASPSTATSGFGFGGGAATGATSTAARSLFGGASPGAAGTAAPSSGFSFGAAPSATGAAPAASGFSFGAAAPAATGTSGFFGGGAATAPATGSGFFGTGSSAAAPAAGSGVSSFFGAAPAATGASSFLGGNAALTTAGTAPGGSFGFFGGGAAAAPQQNGQGITLETAFEALPADVKKNIVEFHKVLQGEDQADAFLRTVSPRKLAELDANIARLDQEVLVRRNVQDRQATAVHHARRDTKHVIRQVDAATLSMRTLDGDSAAHMYHIMRHVETPSPYYWELLDRYESRMAAIKAQIEDLESEYKPLYERRAHGGSSSSSSASGMTPALLHQIMRQQNASLMQVAARVAEVHERAEEMRALFLVTMRQDMARHGELSPAAAFTNPFEKRKKSAGEDKRETIDKIRFRTSVAPTIVAAPAAQQPAVAAPASSFGGFGGFGAAAPATPSVFGSTPAFGSSAAPVATTTPAALGGFGFGSSTAAPKQVSFSLGAAAPGAAPSAGAAPAPAAPTVSAFSVPSVATSGSAFGSSFLAGAAPTDAEKRAASSKRLGGRAKKRA